MDFAKGYRERNMGEPLSHSSETQVQWAGSFGGLCIAYLKVSSEAWLWDLAELKSRS